MQIYGKRIYICQIGKNLAANSHLLQTIKWTNNRIICDYFAISIFSQNCPQIRIICKYKKRHHICIKFTMRGIAVFALRHMVQSRSQFITLHMCKCGQRCAILEFASYLHIHLHILKSNFHPVYPSSKPNSDDSNAQKIAVKAMVHHRLFIQNSKAESA